MKNIKPGSADWNTLEEMIQRCGETAVKDAVEIIAEQMEDDTSAEDVLAQIKAEWNS